MIVGAGAVSAVAQVVDVADDGVVHVRPLPGPVSANAHLLGHRGAARQSVRLSEPFFEGPEGITLELVPWVDAPATTQSGAGSSASRAT